MSADIGKALAAFDTFLEQLGSLRKGAVILYVQALLYAEDAPIVKASYIGFWDNGAGFADELCGAGLLSRIHDDAGDVIAYRVVVP